MVMTGKTSWLPGLLSLFYWKYYYFFFIQMIFTKRKTNNWWHSSKKYLKSLLPHKLAIGPSKYSKSTHWRYYYWVTSKWYMHVRHGPFVISSLSPFLEKNRAISKTKSLNFIVVLKSKINADNDRLHVNNKVCNCFSFDK